jgi:predicted DCC family thiol-disulfide oxidoreductase YuxK
LRIARKMDGLWPAMYLFIIIPRPVRDLIYKLIAKNRYKLFGRYNQCPVPDEQIKHRFIE